MADVLILVTRAQKTDFSLPEITDRFNPQRIKSAITQSLHFHISFQLSLAMLRLKQEKTEKNATKNCLI